MATTARRTCPATPSSCSSCPSALRWSTCTSTSGTSATPERARARARESSKTPAPMNFRSIYQHGFARVAACTGRISVADPPANAEVVLRLARECADEGVAVAVFPELNLTGYSIEDLLH